MDTQPKTRPLSIVPVALVLTIAVYAAATGCGGGGSQSSESPAETAAAPPAAGGGTEGGDTAAAVTLDGAKIYAQRCALCHGAGGHGDGPASKGLKPPPANHTDGKYMSTRSDEDLIKVITSGKGAMPAWGAVLTQDQIKAVLAHVRSLAK